MDKRQLRQSAVADFMESLEQLNELWDHDTEPAGCEETIKTSEASSERRCSGSTNHSAAQQNSSPERETR